MMMAMFGLAVMLVFVSMVSLMMGLVFEVTPVVMPMFCLPVVFVLVFALQFRHDRF